MHPASAISVQASLSPTPFRHTPTHLIMAMQSDAQKMVEAMDRHYEYLAKLSNPVAADRLNEAKAKTFTRDIARLNITSDEDGVMLQDCVERGTWAEVPWSESPNFYLPSGGHSNSSPSGIQPSRPRASSHSRPRASSSPSGVKPIIAFGRVRVDYSFVPSHGTA